MRFTSCVSALPIPANLAFLAAFNGDGPAIILPQGWKRLRTLDRWTQKNGSNRNLLDLMEHVDTLVGTLNLYHHGPINDHKWVISAYGGISNRNLDLIPGSQNHDAVILWDSHYGGSKQQGSLIFSLWYS